MQFNQKLIKQLAEGKIVLENRPKESNKVRAILKEAFPKQGYTEAYYNYYFVTNNNKDDYECTDARDYAQCRGTITPIADFLLPEPKFKVGERVIVSDHPLIKEAVIKEAKRHPNTGNWIYVVSNGMTGSYITEDFLSEQLANGSSPTGTPKFKVGDRVIHKESTGNNSFIVHHINWCNDLKDFCCYPEKGIGIAEFALVLAQEVESGKYEIGKTYEFRIEGVLPWEKGVLMAIIDDRYKYVVRRNNGNIMTFPDIRHTPPTPVKIERWAMYSKKTNTFFGKPRNTRNEAEASYKHAPLDYSPIKLEGTYYVDPD